MKVLHLPVNIASIPFYTIRGLQQIGIQAMGLVFGEKNCQTSNGLTVISYPDRNDLIKETRAKILFSSFFIKMVRWADIVHWYFGSSRIPWNLDIKYIRLLRKPALVEWLGSDIRIPEVEFNDNPYYRKTLPFVSLSKQYKKSLIKQLRFAHAGFETLVTPCMRQYIFPSVWNNKIHVLRQRIMTSDFKPCYPEPTKQKPLIVHGSTNALIKGTSFVISAIEKLKKKYKFEFFLIQNLSHEKALEIIKRADIYLDQFILGSHGMAALEAMAYGKPVVCYIKPSLISTYPEELPIINANPDNLIHVLGNLILNGKLRHEIGKNSRCYVEKYHDAVKLAYDLKEIYAKVIQRKKS
ncbi:MAG: glycosyltransferase [Candidatus Omnitrophica bacterium]|nr:glycosyltransferase [Candidatus Omnitrophota bacterium]